MSAADAVPLTATRPATARRIFFIGILQANGCDNRSSLPAFSTLTSTETFLAAQITPTVSDTTLDAERHAACLSKVSPSRTTAQRGGFASLAVRVACNA